MFFDNTKFSDSHDARVTSPAISEGLDDLLVPTASDPRGALPFFRISLAHHPVQGRSNTIVVGAAGTLSQLEYDTDADTDADADADTDADPIAALRAEEGTLSRTTTSTKMAPPPRPDVSVHRRTANMRESGC